MLEKLFRQRFENRNGSKGFEMQMSYLVWIWTQHKARAPGHEAVSDICKLHFNPCLPLAIRSSRASRALNNTPHLLRHRKDAFFRMGSSSGSSNIHLQTVFETQCNAIIPKTHHSNSPTISRIHILTTTYLLFQTDVCEELFCQNLSRYSG